MRVSEERESLRKAVAKLLKEQCPPERLRKHIEAKRFDVNLWDDLADLGVLGLPLPEAVGGAGGSLADSLIVHEELGRVLAPVPVLQCSAVLIGDAGRVTRVEITAAGSAPLGRARLVDGASARDILVAEFGEAGAREGVLEIVDRAPGEALVVLDLCALPVPIAC